ncbi:MAG: hypothetical protein C4548_06210 [Desulfobacteraceae bacterium]|nr:MAG: hypothetical protein C4548_06210 [Desulfobacteraceae bacterium]
MPAFFHLLILLYTYNKIGRHVNFFLKPLKKINTVRFLCVQIFSRYVRNMNQVKWQKNKK